MSAVAGVRTRTRDVAPLPVDSVLLGAIAALLGLGLVMVTSASMSLAERSFGGPFYFFSRQLVAVAAGLALGAIVYRLPSATWERYGRVLVIAAFVLLLVVLIPGFGRTVNGSTRWLSVAGVNLIQVSEPARLLLLLWVAGYAVRRNSQLRSEFSGLGRPLVVIGAACALLLAQPDFGSGAMLMLVAIAVLFVAGARLRDFLLCVGAVGTLGAVIAIAAPYRVVRLTSFLDPWRDPFDSGFQLTQSLMAIGSGEWTGLGLGGSVQKLFYLPEAHTDFLFAVIAEEFGLLGSFVVIALFAVVTWRALLVAGQAAAQERAFQACVAFGFATWQAAQAFINMGVNMGILPTKGLTLPLMSYGRSSMIVTLVGFAILLRIDRENREQPGSNRRRASPPGRAPG